MNKSFVRRKVIFVFKILPTITMYILQYMIMTVVKDVLLRKKTAVLLDFVQMRGGRAALPPRALPKFFVTFTSCAFLVNKGVHFFENANNLNLKLFC